ncbi:MAG: radical SAM family heme chaperone HemW [Candidatus Gracilibacteria bacterium]
MFCYIHIPFCQSRCRYCRFSTFAGKPDLDKEIYVDYLVKNIENGVLHTPCTLAISQGQNSESQKTLNSIYFGGGTPTSLSNSQLEKIILALKNRFGFEKDIEITLETTINNITEENLIIWKKIGINRLSIGIQTLNNQSLKEIGRPAKEEILKKLDIIKRDPSSKKRPVSSGNISLTISIDFIIGLPYVKKGELLQDLKFIIEKYDFINHISLYMLEEYYDYPEKWQDLSIKEEDFLEEYLLCKNYLEEKGFNRYELSNFAKKGFDCKHNKAYWNHENMLALGLGAHGFLDGVRYAYSNKFNDYYSGKLDYEEILSKDDLFLEKIMFGLRTAGLEPEIYKKLNQEKINYFIKQNLLDFRQDKLVLLDNGVVLIDYIIKEII